ncbi:MAG: ATP-binding cassette domain-containing protein [Paludibacteraceae bacterium]|nr:ATP-binding cassette domain-containing protein [Paludibacteraceae bacterium]MBR1785953.1 ATP-binding cassette domain-containing protein [Paludibacteraceae bacterium]
MIEVQNIVKQFEGHTVLDDVSVSFGDGKVNMIIGQSGSGKTVLMKSLIGLHKVDAGHILYDNRDLTTMKESDIRNLRREMGMLFQGAALFDSETVLDNVLFPLEMFSTMSKSERQDRAVFCLNRVNMPERSFHLMPSEISGGMQKRVAIARAIAMNPKYLFCDEPNSGLDPHTSLVIDHLIQEITQEYNICTIVNSHDMNSIMEIGDNILFLKNGKKEWQGSRTDIFTAESQNLQDFVFASELYKKIKKVHI